MSGDDRLKPAVLGGNPLKLRPMRTTRVQASMLMLLAFAALALLSGCSTPAGAGSPDPTVYNPNTGYPAIGAGTPRHL